MRDATHTIQGWEDVQTRLRPEWDELKRFLDSKLGNEASRKPKYKLLHDALHEAIQKGVITRNSRLPTELELTDITPFSLGTVQRALKNLVEEGIIARKSGIGTIVVPWRWRLEKPLHTKFYGDDGNPLPVFTDVLSRRKVTKEGPWSDFLKDRDQIILIKRRLDVGREFDIYNEFYIDGTRYPVFRDTAKRSLNGINFKHLLAREFNLAITTVSNRLSVAPTPTDVARALGLKDGAPCLRVRALVYSNANPLYYQEYWIPSGARELNLDSALDNLAEI